MFRFGSNVCFTASTTDSFFRFIRVQPTEKNNGTHFSPFFTTQPAEPLLLPPSISMVFPYTCLGSVRFGSSRDCLGRTVRPNRSAEPFGRTMVRSFPGKKRPRQAVECGSRYDLTGMPGFSLSQPLLTRMLPLSLSSYKLSIFLHFYTNPISP